MAIFGMGAMLGPIVGPLLGGWITDNWSWRWIFYINIPIGILSIIMNIIVIEDPPYMKRQKMKIDYWGLVFLAVGLGALQFVLDKGESEDWFGSDLIVAFAVISVVSLVLLVINEYYSEHPIVNLRLFKDRTFTSGVHGHVLRLPEPLRQHRAAADLPPEPDGLYVLLRGARARPGRDRDDARHALRREDS